MDAVDYRDTVRLSAGRMRWWSGTGKQREEEEEEEDEELVEVLLQGKAPWGFTLRGGTEHREPLVITKVEEGSLAAAAHLRAGDEMVSVNAVPLSGSRQEAICLVKSSHKTLTLVVRRYPDQISMRGQRVKMVDVVSPRTMPSESEVHVARSFLTRILRSSMRKNRFRGKNDPTSRPHSWHSSKLREEESESAGREAPPAPVWQPKHEARPKEAPGDQNPQHQLISQSSMDRLERASHPYPPGRLSPVKYGSGAEPLCAPGGKRESGFSCFSSGSSPPVHDHAASSRKGTSTENIFYKGQCEQTERPRYLQPTLGNGGWEGSRPEEPPACRASAAGRPSAGPVWQVPEKKKSQSPPPPPPPLRSDSFAATKVFPYSEGPSKGPENHQNNKTSESRRSFNPLPTKDLLQPAAADHNHNQLHPHKLFSLSSNDVRHSHYSKLPVHQRQHSDESPFYLQTRTAPATKTQSVGSYYRSLQDLPANAFSRKQVRHSTAGADSHSSRYYAKPAAQIAEHKSRQVKTDKPHRISSSDAAFPGSVKTNVKAKFSLPQSQTPYADSKERNGLSHLHYSQQASEEAPQRPDGPSADTKRHFAPHQSPDQKVVLTRLQDPWVPQDDHRISPLKTPLLHCLAQESRTLAERPPPVVSTQDGDSTATGGGKVNRRSDRYATTLRKEIQQKRAQLQKSRSAATLTCDAEDEDGDEWRSMDAATSSGVSFSNTYKDHLKEAQARVLQATSFQRRDLEPLGPEAPLLKASNGRVRGRKRLHLAKRTHSFSEPDKIDKVGVEGEPQTGSFGERRRFFETKPAFSRPVLKSGQGTNTDLDETAKPKDRPPSRENLSTDPLSPRHTQVLLDQQRLGTFAEYQATWSKQKKSSEVKTQGRYHSAENILDAGAEDRAVCVHERSRSSPSADFYTQNMWSDHQTQQSCSRAESSRPQYEPDHNPQLVPRNQGLLPDHRTKADSAGPSHTTLSQSLLPPPRPHIVPQTTSSSQEFLAGAQAAVQPVSSSDTQHHAPASSSPRLSRMSGPDMSKAEVNTEAEQQPPAALCLPAAAWSPSPQFAPLKLTDQPPAALRSEHGSVAPAVMDPSSPVRKVPVRIIQSSCEREERAYLPQNTETCCVFERPPHVPSLSTSEHPASSLFSTYTRQAAPDRASAPAEDSSSAGGRHSEEDAKREELARDIMGKDKSLVDILDQSGRKTTMDLMEGLFPPEKQILEGAQQRRRASAGSRLPTSSPRSTDRRDEDSVSAAAAASLVPSSSYYNTSAPKAELLIKMKDMQEQLEEQDSEDELDVDLASKKKELISSLAKKLEVLREARQSLQEDVEDNEALGREVEATAQRLCQPNQLDKFRMFVGDLDKVVSLLLSLSGRLARVENALNSLEDEAPPEEKRTLTEKRKLLMRQHEDAKELKENLDRRERLVSGIMEAHLNPESLDDYRHFVKMKSALIIEQRKLEDKIKLGEEQLKCLVDSLPLEQRPPL